MATGETVQIPFKTCSVHEHEELTVYCKDCTFAICIECCRGDHLNHHVEGVSKYAREVKSRIPSICQNIRSEILPQMKEKVDSLRDAVQTNQVNCEKECFIIDEMKNTLMNTARNFFEEEIAFRRERMTEFNDEMTSNQHILEENIDGLEKICCIFEKASIDHSNHEIIEIETRLTIQSTSTLHHEDLSRHYCPDITQFDSDKCVDEFKAELLRIMLGDQTLVPEQNEEQACDVHSSSSLIIIKDENLTITEHASNGTFGRGVCTIDDDTTAKVSILSSSDTTKHEAMTDVAKFLCEMDHKHVLCLLGICSSLTAMRVIYETVSEDRGNLQIFLRENRTFPTASIVHLMWQITEGMVYLHQQRVIHRDLRLENIWFSEDNTLKIGFGDMNITMQLEKDNEYYEFTGHGLIPPKWYPPEAMFHGMIGRFTDIWSFGVVLWEAMSYGDLPYKGMTKERVIEYLCKENKRLQKPDGCPQGIYNIMMDCWQFKQDDRPQFTQLEKAFKKQYDVLKQNQP